ncbi:MAG TPA: hypothetical protein VG275_06965 [Solirubrobacteraceae bacterium]|nr:hypothetical protein [Solirubrobacteraceae bacterium]
MSPVYQPVVVPAIPPKGPPLSLLASSVKPGSGSDPSAPVFEVAGEQLALMPGEARAELEARKGEAWTRGITYAPENHYAVENRSGYDGTSVDEQALPAPTGLAGVPSTGGGTLTAGAKAYQVTAVNANGETTALAAITVTTTGTTGSVALSWNPTADGVTYKVYGRVSGSVGLIATVGPFDPDNPPAYLDTGTPAPGAAPPVTNTTGGVGPYGNLPIVTCIPWLMVAEDSCTSFGFEERDFRGRALRLLENATPQAIEREFWTGALAQAAGWPNNYLTNAASYTDLTPAGTPPSVARGQQILQDAIASTGFGGQGMIHCQPQTAPNLLNARRLGNLLLDIFDNLIVPGVGYPGTASGVGTPAAGTAVMFATDLVMTRTEGEGTVFPDSYAEALDRGQAGQPNRITFRAEKFGMAYFDAAVHFACRVTLAT